MVTKSLQTPFEPPKPHPKALDAVVKTVLGSEPCFWLAEFNQLSQSGKTMCRYQLLKVVRNDQLVTAYVYLGPAKKFEAQQFSIPGGPPPDERGHSYAVHTVEELQDIADWMREEKPKHEIEPQNLQAEYHDLLEEKARFPNRQSTFGYKGQITR